MLRDAHEPSLQSIVDDHARKATLLAAASYFEHQVTQHLTALAAAAGNDRLCAFVRNKAIARQYHTLFDWNARNANTFFSLFGPEFKARMAELVDGDEALANGIRAFLELGQERNRLVHQDYASFTLEKTSTEIFALYQSALTFVSRLPSLLQPESEADADCSAR